MSKNGILYHCTQIDHGQFLIIDRRTPQRSKKEPDTPRLCVGPSVAHCFAARLFHPERPVYVYATEQKTRGIKPVDVWDEIVTRERWLIPPGRLKLETILDEDVVAKATTAIWLYHQETRQASSYHLRIAQLVIAANAIRPDIPDTPSFSWMAREFLKTDDAENWVLQQAENIIAKKSAR